MGNFFKSKGHRAAIAISLFVTSLYVIWIVLSITGGSGLVYMAPALWLIDTLAHSTAITPMNVLFNFLLEPFIMTYATTWLFIGFWKLTHRKP